MTLRKRGMYVLSQILLHDYYLRNRCDDVSHESWIEIDELMNLLWLMIDKWLLMLHR